MKVSERPLNPKALHIHKEEDLSKERSVKNLKERPSLSTHLNISNQAKTFQEVKDLVLQDPNQLEREKKVAHLQKLIDSGKYKVDPEALSGKLLKEHLLMKD